MPDQLPSAILDSSNAFDTLFTLNLDTKQRFDNILSGVQKPIDYPIPDYNKDFTPQGLPQGELLDPNKMAGSIGEALFSPDVRVAQYATDKLKSMQSRYPINQGIGQPDRFEYAKEMDKYLKGDYGYNPYMSLQDNEDFNYRYDYLNQNLAKRFFSNVGTGLTRFIGSVGLKLGQTIGYLGAMIGNGVEEIFNSKDNNFMADVADNSLSRWFEGLEEDMKSSNLLSVFKPRDWDDRGFFNKLGHGAFWTDEVADGAAFMGEMVASMYLLGGLGRIGGLGRFGATEINLTKSLSKLGNVGKNTGRALDGALKLATGAKDLSGVGRWAFATTSESAFEASQVYKERKERLKSDRENGLNEYSDLEIETIAGDSAAATFKANMLILSASNAFENRFIYGPLFKRLGLDTGPTNSKASLIDVNRSVDSLDDIAKASRRTYNYKTYLGKKLDWKNSNSRGRFYGSRALSATAAEGFWEENAQLASERLASANNLTLTSFLTKMKDQTLGALTGDDPEAATSIGLGALIGGGATTAISKVRGGDRLFQGERKKIEADTLQTAEVYEQFRKGFLNYQDIYVRDPQTGKPIMDSEGNLQIDETKAAGLLDGTNKFLSKQAAADKVADPIFRKQLQDEAMRDYVVAAKMAGIYNKAEQVFESLRDASPEQLTNLGFDPNSTVDSVYLRDSLKQFGTIYDSVQKAPPPRFKQGDTLQDDVRRRGYMYEAATAAYSASKIIGEYQSKMLDKDFPSVFSPEAEANTSEVQQYNSLLHQRYALNQFDEMTSEHTDFFKGYAAAERRRISEEMARLEKSIDLMLNPEEGEPADIEQDDRGFLYTPSKYEPYITKGSNTKAQPKRENYPDEASWQAAMNEWREGLEAGFQARLMFDVDMDAQRKHAEYTNIRNQNQYLVNKFSNQETGIENTKAYRAYLESVHRRDQEVDEQQNPPTTPPPTGTAPATQPLALPPAAPTSPTPTPQQAAQGAEVTNNLQGLLDTATTDIKEGRQPDFPTLTNYIVDNQSTFEDLISKQLLDFLSQFGEVVAESIRNGTYVPNSDDDLEYTIATLITGEIIQDTRISTPIVEGISTYVNQLESAKKAFQSAPLNDTEKTAVAVISAISGLENSSLAPYIPVLTNTNATDAEKRQALRGISDQYLAEGTSDVVGPLLGQAGRDAIDSLGYPVPGVLSELNPPTASETLPEQPEEETLDSELSELRVEIIPATATSAQRLRTEDGQTYLDIPRIRDLIRKGNAIRDSLPPVQEGFTRLWRGNRQGEVGQNPSFTNSLEGIALPFQEVYGGPISYVDVPTADLPTYLQTVGSAPGAEFILPAQLAATAKVIPTVLDTITEVVEEPDVVPEGENFLELTKVGKTRVVYDRVNRKYVYFTESGKQVRLPQAKKISTQITPRFFGVWFRELSDATQRAALENISKDVMDALQQAQGGQPFDTLDLVLMRNIRKMKFTPSIMSNLTDVSRSAWTSEEGEPIDTFVTDFLLGEGNILEQNGFYGYDEQDLINRVLDLISQYPDGIRLKDIKSKERENDPGAKLKELEESFFDLSGLDLIKSLELYNNEKLNAAQSVDNTPLEDATTPTLEERRQAALDSIQLEAADEASGNVMYMAVVDGEKWQDFEEDDLRERINKKYDNEAAGIVAPVVVASETPNEPVEPETSLFETQNDPPDASGRDNAPPPEPPIPEVAENSDEESSQSDNYIDILVDNSKIAGDLLFPETMPAEVVMEGDKPKIVNGAIQLKTTTGDQQRQAKRAHNIKKQMGDRNKPVNFWSEDAQGNPLYKVKLEIGNQDKHGEWVYDTGRGLTNQTTGKPNKFPFIVAMVIDQQGNYVYFDDNGNISNKAKGMPFGFAYTVEDYKPLNLKFSRRGLQLKTGELLNGQHGFLTQNPLQDLRDALYKGINITGTILEVASGKLSTYNVDNSGATYAKTPIQRTVKEMIEAGDVTDSSTFVLSTGQFTRNPVATASETEAQLIKVGQPYLLDEKSGLKIPLRGKKLKDLTLDGKPLLSQEIKIALEELSTRGFTQVTEGDPTPEEIELLENMFVYLRALVYSQNTPIFMNKDKSMISMLDQRTTNIPLLETELNYSTNIEILRDPFDTESEGFTYEDFVKENFLSGVVPVEIDKGEKLFAKLNRRIIFILDKNHQEILDSTGSTTKIKTARTKTDNYPSFVNKTYKQRGGSESTVTITGFADGKFTISGPKGTITQPAEDFMKQLPNLEEVKLPAPSDEVITDFENNIKLSQDKQKELNEKAKTMSKKDLDDLNFDC